MTATCISCGRIYETTELEVKLVQEGKLSSLCPYCDGSHNDFDDHDIPPEPYEYPPEQEDIDDDKRKGI